MPKDRFLKRLRVRLKEDLKEGARRASALSTAGLERTFSEIERLKYRVKIDRIDRRLSERYAEIGRRAYDRMNQGRSPLFDEEEKRRLFSAIEDLLVQKERFTEEMRGL